MNTTNGNFIERSVNIDNAVLTVNVKGVPTEVPLNAVKPYKSYVAFVTQTGTAAPVSVILSNELNSTFEWQYAGVGIYYLHAFEPVFKNGKSFCMTDTSPNSTLILATFGPNPGDPTSFLTLKTYSTALVPTNGWEGYIEVRVY